MHGSEAASGWARAAEGLREPQTAVHSVILGCMDLRKPTRFRHGDDVSASRAPKGISGRALKAAVERALRMQQPRVIAHISKLRRKNPEATPEEMIAALNRRYRLAITGIGAAGGGIAVVPGIGTALALIFSAGEATAALDASVLYTLAVAEVYGLSITDVERRRALVLGIILGEGGAQLMAKVTGGSRYWARDVVDILPMPKLGPVNQTLARWFIKRYVLRQAVLAFGRALPFGIGAVIGALGNLAVARAVIHSTRQAFGPPPQHWPAPVAQDITARQ